MKRIVVSTAVLALACAGLSTASAAPAQYKVTGGGQITEITTEDMMGNETVTPVKQTLAFNAQSEVDPAQDDAARGQLQFDDHAGTKFHGTVTCLQVDPAQEGMPRTARIGGEYTDATGAPASFRIFISDTDFGGPQNQNEMLTFTRAGDDEQNCDAMDDEASMTLGNGNIVIHKDKAPDEGGAKGKPAFSLR